MCLWCLWTSTCPGGGGGGGGGSCDSEILSPCIEGKEEEEGPGLELLCCWLAVVLWCLCGRGVELVIGCDWWGLGAWWW